MAEAKAAGKRPHTIFLHPTTLRAMSKQETKYKVKILSPMFDAPKSRVGEVWEFKCQDHCPPAVGERMVVGECEFETGANHNYVGEVVP